MSINSSDLSACTSAIHEYQRFLVIPHANVDPDGLSSALACFHMLTALGKDVTVVCPDTKPESLSFLPGFEHFTQDLSGNQQFVITVNLDDGVEVDKLRYTVEDQKVNIIIVPKTGAIQSKNITLGGGDQPYDCIIAVDTADLHLFGSAYTDNIDLFSSVPIMNIDHHISNTRYGQLHMIDPTASSATEVLYHWFTQVPSLKEQMTPDIATLLLTGLITDTRSFQNPNTTPRSLEVAAELLEYGARQQEIIQHVYKTKPLSTLKIWGRALNGIQMDKNVGIVWSSVSKEDLAEMDASSKETGGILDELISTIPDADVHVLFTELEDGGLKASMRSSESIDVSALAGQTYGGGGHARAAGFRVAEFSNFSLQVIQCVTKLKEGMANQRAVVNDPPKNFMPKLPLVEGAKATPQIPNSKPQTPNPKSVDVVGTLGGGDEKKGGTDIMKEISGSNEK
ncbi:MAG: DHH family phosphoesterase [bacterium]|nr:DHH family phosphoesterase [bacterium]